MKQQQKNKYDPKIETVKYLVLFDQKDQNKSWLIFNTDSKMCKFSGLVYRHSIFYAILFKLHITIFQTLNCFCLKFEQNCYYIGGGDTRPLKIDAIVFNLTVASRTKIIYILTICGPNDAIHKPICRYKQDLSVYAIKVSFSQPTVHNSAWACERIRPRASRSVQWFLKLTYLQASLVQNNKMNREFQGEMNIV